MTAQNHPPEDLPEAEATTGTEPLGPIMVPSRSRIGARALALVGTVGLTALGVTTIIDGGPSTWPTISFY